MMSTSCSGSLTGALLIYFRKLMAIEVDSLKPQVETTPQMLSLPAVNE